jgi:nucleoside-diphosphate-sugar epimerase
MPRPSDAGASPRRPVCLVTGATGAIGPSVVNAFAETHTVRTLSRRPPDHDLFSVPVTAVTGDVSDPTAVRNAARGADVIVHLAALLHIVNPATRLCAEYERTNVAGTSVVIAAALAEGVSRVVMMSSIAVYGYGAHGPLNEESAPRPETVYGRTKLAAEQAALAARRGDGLPLAVVLRAAAVYGPRVKGNYDRLVRALSKRRLVPIGRGDNRRTLIYQDDLASATVLAASHPAAAGRIYNVSDGTSHTVREVIAAICAALGRQPPRWHAPVGLVQTAVRAASLVDGRYQQMLEKYLEEVVVDASRIRTELGFRASTGLAQGWAATISEMRRTSRL